MLAAVVEKITIKYKQDKQNKAKQNKQEWINDYLLLFCFGVFPVQSSNIQSSELGSGSFFLAICS
jgi:hypothetical protein